MEEEHCIKDGDLELAMRSLSDRDREVACLRSQCNNQRSSKKHLVIKRSEEVDETSEPIELQSRKSGTVSCFQLIVAIIVALMGLIIARSHIATIENALMTEQFFSYENQWLQRTLQDLKVMKEMCQLGKVAFILQQSRPSLMRFAAVPVDQDMCGEVGAILEMQEDVKAATQYLASRNEADALRMLGNEFASETEKITAVQK